MGALAEYKSFTVKAGLICLGGLLIMGVLTFSLVWAQSSTTPVAYTETGNKTYNEAGSYGITGMAPLTVQPTENTPKFIANPLKEGRGVILLVHVEGASDDEAMMESFASVKAQYAAQASFFNFESRDVSEMGDVVAQLRIATPPALAVISGDGNVYQMYTGWIGEKVMEQVVANAIRQ